MATSDAVDRETAWLLTTGDGLPSLLGSGAGQFGNIQAYQPRTPGRRGSNLFVLRRTIHDKRFASPRRMADYAFVLKLYWPLSSGQGKAEDDQRAFDVAVDKLLQRIDGFPTDHSHGGRFRSVAEDPAYVDVHFTDPEQTLGQGEFRAEVTYFADDFDVVG
jgi:hypothetical protein